MRTPGRITLSAPTVTSSPIATPSWTRTWARRSQPRPTIAPSTSVLRPMYVEASTIERTTRPRSRTVTLVEVHPVPQPDVAADPDARDLEADPLVERVEVRLAVLVEVADVLPVALEHMSVEGPSHLQEQREELLREVVRTVVRDMAEHLGLEHVDAGVDGVGEHLPPGGLLEEPLDPPVLVGDDDPELERVLDRLQRDRRRSPLLPVSLDEPAGGAPYRAGGAERRVLDRVADLHAQGLAAAEVAADRLRQEGDGDDDLLEAVAAEELDDVLHAGLADDRHHRLRLVRRQRTQPRPLPAGHDHGLHRRSSPQARRT